MTLVFIHHSTNPPFCSPLGFGLVLVLGPAVRARHHLAAHSCANFSKTAPALPAAVDPAPAPARGP